MPDATVREPFQPEHLVRQANMPVKLKKNLNKFKDASTATSTRYKIYSETPVFKYTAMEALQDLLLYPGNEIFTFLYEGWPCFYQIRPVAPPYAQAYPCYAEIAAQRPADLHFFRKFDDADFFLVSEHFVQEVARLKLKGFTCMLRWDGTNVYPKVPE